MILPLSYQSQDSAQRKSVVLEIKSALQTIDGRRFPNIASTIKSGNTKINALVNLIIVQMYSVEFDLERSLLAVEENI